MNTFQKENNNDQGQTYHDVSEYLGPDTPIPIFKTLGTKIFQKVQSHSTIGNLKIIVLVLEDLFLKYQDPKTDVKISELSSSSKIKSTTGNPKLLREFGIYHLKVRTTEIKN